MITNKKYTINISRIPENEYSNVGIKAVKLTRLEEAKIPIAPGFVLLKNAFDDTLIANNIIDEMTSIIDSLNPENMKTIKSASKKLTEIVQGLSIPELITESIEKYYKSLTGFADPYFKVMVSPINNKLNETLDSYLSFDASGSIENLISSIKNAWAQIFSQDAIYNREKIGYIGELSAAVIILRVPQVENTGIAFNFDQLSNDKSIIEIEAYYGVKNNDLSIDPDIYKVKKSDKDIFEKNIVGQKYMYVRINDAKNNFLKRIEISPVWQKKQKIDNLLIEQIARIVSKAGDILDSKIEVEWIKNADKVYLTDVNLTEDLSTEPVSIPLIEMIHEESPLVETKPKIPQFSLSHSQLKKDVAAVLLQTGKGNNKGFAWGKSKNIKSFDDFEIVSENDLLLISPSLNIEVDDLKPYNFGGLIYSKELDLDVPAIFTEEVLSIHEGELISINSDTGEIYKGIVKATEESSKPKTQNKKLLSDISFKHAINLYINFDEALYIDKEIHNLAGIITPMNDQITKLAPQLKSGHIIVELSFDPNNPDSLKPQLSEIRDMRNIENHRNIWISFNNIKRAEDYLELKKIFNSSKLKRSSTLKLMVTIDNPAAVLGIDEILSLDTDIVIFDAMGFIYDIFKSHDFKFFKESAFKQALERVIKECQKAKTNVILKGNLPKEIYKNAIHLGINGLSIKAEKVAEIEKLIQFEELERLKK